MSIASAINNLQGRVANAYTAIDAKGGTLPATQDTASLPAAISSIPDGRQWGMTMADLFPMDAQGRLQFSSLTNVSFSGLREISGAQSRLHSFFASNTFVRTIVFPDLERIQNSNQCLYSFAQNATQLTGVSFPKLTHLQAANALNYLCASCTRLTLVDFQLLAVADGAGTFSYAFNGCGALQSISFPSLRTIGNNSTQAQNVFNMAFANCANLREVLFPALEAIYSLGCFASAFNSQKLTSMTFPELTTIAPIGTLQNYSNVFYNNNILRILNLPKLATLTNSASMFANCSNLREIHFGAANQAAIEAASGYATKFGAPNANCQIYFDL